jgi:hypothetical protein
VEDEKIGEFAKDSGGNTAQVFMNSMMCTNNACRMEQITNWFDDDPSPSNTPSTNSPVPNY